MEQCRRKLGSANSGNAAMTDADKYDPAYARTLLAQADARLTPADKWWQAEMRALHLQRIELVHNERVMVRVLVKVSIGLMAIVLSSAWLWMHLTGRS
jgi:hypothetical protein